MNIKIIVHTLIKNDQGKFLILQRSKQNDVLPLKWDIPGGMVEEKESLVNALSRELFEETRLKIKEPEPFFLTENVDLTKDKHFVKIVFLAQDNYDGNQLIKLNPEEHDDYKWISIDDIDKYDLVDYVRQCLLKTEKNRN